MYSTVTANETRQLRCDYCIKFQLFEGAQDVFSRFTAMCWHATTTQPLQITPALQEACLWALP